MIAAESLASEIGEDHLEKRQLFPAFSEIRDISAHIGAAVAAKAYELGTDLFSYLAKIPYISLDMNLQSSQLFVLNPLLVPMNQMLASTTCSTFKGSKVETICVS